MLKQNVYLVSTENFFNFVNNSLREESKFHRITREMFQEFQERVTRKIAGISTTKLKLSINQFVGPLL